MKNWDYGFLARAVFIMGFAFYCSAHAGPEDYAIESGCLDKSTPESKIVSDETKIKIRGKKLAGQLTVRKKDGQLCVLSGSGEITKSNLTLYIKKIACGNEPPFVPPPFFNSVEFERMNDALEFANSSLGYCGSSELWIRLKPIP